MDRERRRPADRHGEQGRAARIWSYPGGQLLHVLDADNQVLNGANFSPDGRTVLTSGDSDGGDGTARIFSCETCRPLPELLDLVAEPGSRGASRRPSAPSS